MTRDEIINGLYRGDGKAIKEAIKALEQEPCEDAVSRKKVLNTLNRMDSVLDLDEDRTVETYKELLAACYKDLPRVTPTKCIATVKFSKEDMQELVNEKMKDIVVERKKGKWIGHGEHCENLGVIPSGLGAYEWCSNCDCGIDVREWHRNHYNYCPNCGAEMEGEE